MAGTMSKGGKGRGMITGINITPMVDVVLVLLVIMMVSATYIVSQSLKVDLPKAASQTDSVASVAAVTLSKEGKLFFNQKPVTEAGLIDEAQELLRLEPRREPDRERRQAGAAWQGRSRHRPGPAERHHQVRDQRRDRPLSMSGPGTMAGRTRCAG